MPGHDGQRRAATGQDKVQPRPAVTPQWCIRLAAWHAHCQRTARGLQRDGVPPPQPARRPPPEDLGPETPPRRAVPGELHRSDCRPAVPELPRGRPSALEFAVWGHHAARRGRCGCLQDRCWQAIGHLRPLPDCVMRATRTVAGCAQRVPSSVPSPSSPRGHPVGLYAPTDDLPRWPLLLCLPAAGPRQRGARPCALVGLIAAARRAGGVRLSLGPRA